MIQNAELAILAVVSAPPLIICLVAFIYVIAKRFLHVWFEEPMSSSESEESQTEVWSISLPEETTELPLYEEPKAYPENNKPPSYWTIFPYKIYYDQPVITVTL